MKIEYDGTRDLLYVWLGKPGTKAARTETITPGVHADFDREDKLVGLEILESRPGGYCNGPSAATFLTGRSPVDLRPHLRFWNRLSYPRWLQLETAVRTDGAVAWELDAEERPVLAAGVVELDLGEGGAEGRGQLDERLVLLRGQVVLLERLPLDHAHDRLGPARAERGFPVRAAAAFPGRWEAAPILSRKTKSKTTALR